MRPSPLRRVCDDRHVPSTAPRALERIATIRLPSGELRYTFRRSARARRLRVVVDPLRGVVVTVPLMWRGGSAVEAVEAFLVDRDGWLRAHLERHEAARSRSADRRTGILYEGRRRRLAVEPAANGATAIAVAEDAITVQLGGRERRHPDRVLERWLREQARSAIDDRLLLHAPALGVRPSAVTIRDPRTRWGSASKSGRLSFSWRLVLAPPEALETVVVHELAHLRIFGHGPDFWALVASIRPDHRAWRRWLREHSAELHLALSEA